MDAVSPFSSLLIFTFFFSLPGNIHSSSSYGNCAKRFNCGIFRDVDYPFWGGGRPRECGHPEFELNCSRHDGVATIMIKNVVYRVLKINNTADEIKVARDDFFDDGICTSKFVSTSIDDSLFEYTGGEYTNVTILYGCPHYSTARYDLPFCHIHDVPHKNVEVVIGPKGLGACNKSVTVPVPGIEIERHKVTNFLWLSDVIRDHGFKLKWKNVYWRCGHCKGTGEKCGYDSGLNQTTCFCPGDERYDRAICRTPMENSRRVLLLVGIILGTFTTVGIVLAVLFFGLRQRKKKLIAGSISKGLRTTSSSDGLPTPSTKFSRTTHSHPSSLSVGIEKGRSMYFGVQVFTYEELEEATDNFDSSRELGDGGFGVVYKGNLRDGRVVAVKRLYENSFKRVQQFINEVEMLARLRHQNLVSLYGCTSRRSQELLLVYEYISNGTIADHLHGNKANSGLLTWPVRLRIAIESASALAYLHNSEIIHRDVKTNNILLDDDFRVKVADFGLSRLFPNDVTHVSTAPQGTPGYVDPEYYQCYQLTAKSDVYSFGVVLMELITSLEAVDISRHRHDINLSNMAIRKIQNHTLHELVDPSLGFETDCSVRRMTTLVAELAFRCLQQDRDMRPTMEEVVECLRAAEEDEMKRVKPEVVDFYSDDVGLLKSMPPPISPDSDKWAANHVAGANSY